MPETEKDTEGMWYNGSIREVASEGENEKAE